MSRLIDLSDMDFTKASSKRGLSASEDKSLPMPEDNRNQFAFSFKDGTASVKEPEFLQDPCRDREGAIALTSESPAISGEVISPRAPLFGPLRSLDPYRLNSHWQLIEQLTGSLPLNEYDLPVFIYRADMLDYVQIANTLLAASTGTTADPQIATTTSFGPAQHPADSMQDIQASLEAATLPLTYDEGYPVLPSGVPFWSQMEFESVEAYKAFISYLELGGVRQISNLISYEIDEVREYFHTYYWSFRVKAFDLYRVAHHQKVKLQRMLSTEDNHFKMAEKLITKVQTYLEGMILDDENISPEKAINMLEKLVKIQRISAGLPANGESKETDGSRRTVAPVNVIMQQISAGAGTGARKVDSDVDLLLEDPDAVDLAQELIIKMQNGAGNRE